MSSRFRATHALVTLLRRGGLSGPVNLVLRGAFAFWLVGYGYLIAIALSGLHLIHPIPTPNELLDALRRVLAASAHWIASYSGS